MKRLILLLLISASFSTFADHGYIKNLVFSSESFCWLSPKVQERNGLFYLFNQPVPFSGENICVFLNGKYHSKGNILNGLRDGKWTMWEDNGDIHVEGNYIEGKFTGLKTWYEQKMIKSYEELYKDGDLVYRIFFKYYENGQMESERLFQEGRLNGKSTFWHENGQKFAELNYKEDKPDGEWIFWKKNGRKDEERNYKNGDLVNKTIFKYSFFTGHLKSWKKYKDGKCISGDCD